MLNVNCTSGEFRMLYWKLLVELIGKLTKLFSVNFPVKVNRKSELTGFYLKVSSTGQELIS